MSRAGSVDTLSPCESIASDDLILDYEHSDASSYEEQRADTGTALQDMDNATILSELEAQGEDVMRQWSSLLSQTLQQQTNNSNTINNNVNAGSANNNNQPANDIGALIKRVKQLQSPDEDSAGGDYYQLTYPN